MGFLLTAVFRCSGTTGNHVSYLSFMRENVASTRLRFLDSELFNTSSGSCVGTLLKYRSSVVLAPRSGPFLVSRANAFLGSRIGTLPELSS